MEHQFLFQRVLDLLVRRLREIICLFRLMVLLLNMLLSKSAMMDKQMS
jgi:hypothetical protein